MNYFNFPLHDSKKYFFDHDNHQFIVKITTKFRF